MRHTSLAALMLAAGCTGGTQDLGVRADRAVYQQLSSGLAHACGLDAEQRAVCWGWNHYGQLNTTAGYYTEVASGARHACGLTESGLVNCWGTSDGTITTVPSATYTDISAGESHTCGVTTSGTVRCWGDNSTGQIAAPQITFDRIEAGTYTSCGIKSDGSMVCWGAEAVLPPEDATTGVDQVGLGADGGCILNTSGKLNCWGALNSAPPTGIYTDLTVGRHHACVLDESGEAACWGTNTQGQADVPDLRFKQLSAGGNFTCGIDEDDHGICWGGSHLGQTLVRGEPGTFGAVRWINSPNANLQAGEFSEAGTIHLFREKERISLTQDVNLQFSAPGEYFFGSVPSPTTLGVGKFVTSWYLHADGGDIVEGTVVFPGQVVAMIPFSDELQTTDAIFADDDNSYDRSELRGVVYDSPNDEDWFKLLADGNTMELTFDTRSGIDNLRVITVAENPNDLAEILILRNQYWASDVCTCHPDAVAEFNEVADCEDANKWFSAKSCAEVAWNQTAGQSETWLTCITHAARDASACLAGEACPLTEDHEAMDCFDDYDRVINECNARNLDASAAFDSAFLSCKAGVGATCGSLVLDRVATPVWSGTLAGTGDDHSGTDACGLTDGPDMDFTFVAEHEGTYTFDVRRSDSQVALRLKSSCGSSEVLACPTEGETSVELYMQAEEEVLVILDAVDAETAGEVTLDITYEAAPTGDTGLGE